MPRVEENPSILAPFDVKSWWRRQKRLNFDEPSSRRVVQPIVLQLALWANLFSHRQDIGDLSKGQTVNAD